MSLGRAVDRILGLVGWARVARALSRVGKVSRVQTQAHADDELDHVQPYGYTARAKPGAEALTVSVGGSADGRVVLLVQDRRYTIALEEGEVAIVDDLGQKVHLTRDGIVVDAPSIKLGAGATLGVARLTDTVHVNALWQAWFVTVGTLSSAGTPPVGAELGAISSASSSVRSA